MDARRLESCHFCGRAVGRSDNLARHMTACKVANSADGMDGLMDRVVQKQLDEQRRQLQEQNAKIDRLTALLEKQLAAPHAPLAVTNYMPNFEGSATFIAGSVTNIINIRPWNGGDRIIIPVAMLRLAFTENQRLAAYCKLSDDERVDAERAVPYVLEALVDLVRRAHADPQSRNIYLSPKRADQVMICVEDDGRCWKVITLVDAIHSLFDGVADSIHKIMLSDKDRRELPFGIQASASMIPSLYGDEPDKYVELARGHISAHLSNCREAALAAETRN